MNLNPGRGLSDPPPLVLWLSASRFSRPQVAGTRVGLRRGSWEGKVALSPLPHQWLTCLGLQGTWGQPVPSRGVKYGSVLSGLNQKLLWLFAGFSGGTTALASA